MRVGATLAAAATTTVVLTCPDVRLQLCRPFGLSVPKHTKSKSKKLRLNWLVVDALSGAVGEIASLAVLYPLDTIKVRCQAQGANAGTVLQELRGMGCKISTVRALYAGMGSAALCSAVIGAFYLLSFYTVKRVGNRMVQQHQRQQQVQQAVAAASLSLQAAPQPDGDGAAPSGLPSQAEGTHPLVASLAGVSASVVASIFESPMETYKLRAQAGAIPVGSMLGTMVSSALCQGLASLYWSYGAFMIKSIPYDYAELVTYSHMSDLRDAAALRQRHKGGAGVHGGAGPRWQEQLGDAMARAPSGMGDMVIGAVAGAAAVLCSMPCDVVKTHMDLHHHHHPCPAGRNLLLHSATEFFATGRQLMAKGGLRALFVGVTPRLLQTMPSTMVYWFAVENTRRTLLKYVEVPPGEGDVREGGGASAASV